MVGGRFVIVAHWGEQWERQGFGERAVWEGRGGCGVEFQNRNLKKKQESAAVD